MSIRVKFLVTFVFLWLFYMPIQTKANLYINEVMPDSAGDSWVEIYSDTGAVDLSDYVLTTNYNVNEVCSVVSNNSYTYLLSGESVEEFLYIENTSLDFLTDLALYLVDCSEEEISNSLFVPLTGENISQARVYDGASDAEERDYSVSYLNTKGSSNNVVPVIYDAALQKQDFTELEVPLLTFKVKSSDAIFENVKVYVNSFLVDTFSTLESAYESTIDTHEFFYNGTNIVKIAALSTNGSSSVVKTFNYTSSKPTINFDPLSSTSFSSSLNVGGVVTSNTPISTIALAAKKQGDSEFTTFESLTVESNTLKKSFNFNFSPTESSKYTLQIQVVNESGTYSNNYYEDVVYDQNAPSISINLDPKKPDGKNNYYTSKVSVELSAEDIDVTKIYYRFSTDDAWKTYTKKFDVPEGKNTLYYKSLDNAGNESAEGTKNIKVDTIAPNVYVELYPELPDGLNGFYLQKPDIIFNSSFDDVSKYEYSFNKKDWEEYTGSFEAKDINTKFFYRATDEAGNRSDIGFFNLRTAIEKPSIIKSISYEVKENGEVYIIWKDYDVSETYLYEIYRSTDPNITVEKSSFYFAVPSTQNYFIDTKTKEGKTYYYLIVKKGVSGQFSDPVRLKVTVPGSDVLGAKATAAQMVFIKDGPVIKTEKPFVVSSANESAKTTFKTNTFFFFISLSVFAFLLMKFLYKRRVLDAS